MKTVKIKEWSGFPDLTYSVSERFGISGQVHDSKFLFHDILEKMQRVYKSVSSSIGTGGGGCSEMRRGKRVEKVNVQIFAYP